MAFAGGRKPRSGRDDGTQTNTKQTNATTQSEGPVVPDILPGESLRDYSVRVDAALPLTGLVAKPVKNGKDVLGFKAYKTRKERKMHKLYDQWRAEDNKIREKKEEELELAAARALEDGTVMLSSNLDFGSGNIGEGPGRGRGKKKRASRRQKDDPWEELRRKRGEGKPRLGNVASAPPTLAKVTPKLFAPT
jgi:hypothetical protein